MKDVINLALYLCIHIEADARRQNAQQVQLADCACEKRRSENETKRLALFTRAQITIRDEDAIAPLENDSISPSNEEKISFFLFREWRGINC